jgi:hypothetical protein
MYLIFILDMFCSQQLGFDETKPLPKGAEKKSFTKSKEEVSSLPKERIILEKVIF